MLTARPLMRWLYPEAAAVRLVGSQLLGQRLSFALCPRCVESADLPLAGLFAFTVGCPRHSLRLQAACASRMRLRATIEELCATPITLFSGADRFYACPRLECGASYTALPAIALTRDEHAHARAVTSLLQDLLRLAAHAKSLRPGFGNSLRAAFQRSELPDGRAITLGTALRAPRPSLPALIEALVVTKTSVDDWLKQQRDPRNALPAKAVGRAAHALQPFFPSPHRPACPSCDSRQAFRNGRAATLDRSQEFICKSCGTRFTRWQVLFSFDPHERYREVLAARNQQCLDRCRKAVRAVLDMAPGRADYSHRSLRPRWCPACDLVHHTARWLGADGRGRSCHAFRGFSTTPSGEGIHTRSQRASGDFHVQVVEVLWPLALRLLRRPALRFKGIAELHRL